MKHDSMYMSYFLKLLALLKNPSVLFLTLLGGFFAPISGIVFLCVMLAIADFLIKLCSVYLTQGVEAISSKKMESTFFKIMIYTGFICMLHLTDVIFVKDVGADLLQWMFSEDTAKLILKFKLATCGALLVIIREGKSIDESWVTIFGWSFVGMITSNFNWLFKLKSNNSNESNNTNNK